VEKPVDTLPGNRCNYGSPYSLAGFDSRAPDKSFHYENIYLVRNEGHFAIYNFSGDQALQPDFVLFLREKNGKTSLINFLSNQRADISKSMIAGKEPF